MNRKATKHTRKKQPALTRQQILEVAGPTIVQKGLGALTLDAVAEAAGVSKGGLLDHFSSKRDLVEAVIADAFEQFDTLVKEKKAQDNVSTGKSVRALLNAAQMCQADSGSQLWAALLLAGKDASSFAGKLKDYFYEIVRENESSSPVEDVSLAIVYLATDGLALADIAGVFDKDNEFRTRIVEQLERITRNPTKCHDRYGVRLPNVLVVNELMSA